MLPRSEHHMPGLMVSLVIMSLCIMPVKADPITGLSYTYDLSTPDQDPGGFEAFVIPHASADDDLLDSSELGTITTNGMLTDGNFGSLTKVPFGSPPLVIFANGTFAGFRSDLGIGLAPQPKIDIDLGGMYQVDSFTLHYLVEDATSIYSPRPVPDPFPAAPDPDFDALTVFGSSNGVDFTSLGFSNEFNPLFGPDGEVGSGVEEVRAATVNLGGVTVSHLSIDVRTPWAFIFLSEFIVDGAAAAGLVGDYNDNGTVDAADYVVWRNNLNTSNPLQNDPIGGTIGEAHYNQWKSNFGSMSGAGSGSDFASVPEPTSAWLLLAGNLTLLMIRIRNTGDSNDLSIHDCR